METISNVVNTATKAIWGEQRTATNETAGREPVSGVQGKGTVNEPYDQGNAEDLAEPTSKLNINDPAPSSQPETETATSTTHNSSTTHQIPMNPNNVAAGGEPKPLEATEGTGVTGASAQKYEPKAGDVIPSESSSNPGVAPTSGAAPTEKQQGASRPKEAPAGPEAEAIKSTKDDAEAAMTKRDPNDHSGEPMHMHGGPEDTIPETQAERRDSKAGMPGGQEHGKPGKGTGEKWEKSTGLHADGGDFDATRPGAGREADRLLEEKGIHKDAAGAMDQSPPPAGGADHQKVSKMEKLKEKLHIGHKEK